MGTSGQVQGGRLQGGAGWSDLAANAPGIGISHEAARRRRTEGPGADRSWRVGADGELVVAGILAELTTPMIGLGRLRLRRPAWRVLHSVPIGSEGADVDHVLIGPPGVVTINTKHHRRGRLVLDGESFVVNGFSTAYVATSRREAELTTALLGAALAGAGEHDLARRLTVRPVVAVVGGLLRAVRWPAGVTVVTTTTLVHVLRTLPASFDARDVATVHELARRSTTWSGAEGQSSRITERMLPAGSLNQAMGGP